MSWIGDEEYSDLMEIISKLKEENKELKIELEKLRRELLLSQGRECTCGQNQA